MKRKDAEEEEGGSNVVHCNLQQFERHEPNLHSIVNISGVVTIRLGLIYVSVVEQRTFSPATGSRPTTAEFCVFSAPASFATPMTSQARSRFTSLKQTTVTLVDTAVTRCPVNIESSRWTIAKSTSQVCLFAVIH